MKSCNNDKNELENAKESECESKIQDLTRQLNSDHKNKLKAKEDEMRGNCRDIS